MSFCHFDDTKGTSVSRLLTTGGGEEDDGKKYLVTIVICAKRQEHRTVVFKPKNITLSVLFSVATIFFNAKTSIIDYAATFFVLCGEMSTCFSVDSTRKIISVKSVLSFEYRISFFGLCKHGDCQLSLISVEQFGLSPTFSTVVIVVKSIHNVHVLACRDNTRSNLNFYRPRWALSHRFQ